MTTIANSNQATKDSIKALARQDTTSIIGVSIAAQSDIEAAEAAIISLQGQINDIPVGKFNIVVPDNSTVAVLSQVLGYTYTHYLITEDTEVEPAVEIDFIFGIVPSTYDLLTWNIRAVRLYLWDGINVIKVPSNTLDVNDNPIYEIYVDPVSTLPPTIINDFNIVASSSSSAVVTWTNATSNAKPIVYSIYNQSPDGIDIQLATNLTSGDTIYNLTPEKLYSIYLLATDTESLSSISNSANVTLSSLSDGVVSIVNNEYTVSEGNQLTIDLQLVGRTSTNVVGVTVSTKANTATNYVDLVNLPVSFPSGTDLVSVTIDTSNVGASLNNVAELHIDSSSITGGNAVIADYPDNAQIFKILGSVSIGGDVYNEEYTAAQDASVICMEAEGFTSKDNRLQPPEHNWNSFTGIDVYGNDLGIGCIGGDQLSTPWQNDIDYNIYANFLTMFPRINFKVNFTQLGTHYIWMRARCVQGWQNSCYIGFDGADNIIGPDNAIYNANVNSVDGDSKWKWKVGTGTYNVTTLGEHTFNIYRYQGRFNLDRVLITNSVTYTPEIEGANGLPSGSEKAGPPVSSLVGGSVIEDNTNNIQNPTVPDLITIAVDPSIFIPNDNSTGVGVASDLVAKWEVGAHTIKANIIVTDSSSNIISGTSSSALNVLTWTPSQAMANNTVHTVTITGTFIDAAGKPQKIDVVGADWNFVTFNNISPGIIWQSDFQKYTANTNFTLAEAKKEFDTTWGNGFGSKDNPKGPNNLDQWIFHKDDPEGIRGSVMMIEFPPGSGYVDVPHVNTSMKVALPDRASWDINLGYTDIWHSIDVYFSPNWVFGPGVKLPGLQAYGASSKANTGTGGDWCSGRFIVWGDMLPSQVPDTFGIEYRPYKHIPDNKGVIAAYYYHMDGNASQRFMNKDDPSKRPKDFPASHWEIPTGQWIRLKQHFVLNTVTSNDGVEGVDYLRNGIIECYVNGQLMYNRTNLRWRDRTDVQFNYGYFSHMWGGQTEVYRSPLDRNQQCYFDRWVISTTDPDL